MVILVQSRHIFKALLRTLYVERQNSLRKLFTVGMSKSSAERKRRSFRPIAKVIEDDHRNRSVWAARWTKKKRGDTKGEQRVWMGKRGKATGVRSLNVELLVRPQERTAESTRARASFTAEPGKKKKKVPGWNTGRRIFNHKRTR
jgi:hypothetical protein